MGEFALTRVDERLAHGVVTSQWIPFSGAKQCICIDDVAAADQFLVMIHAASVKPGVLMETISFDEAFERNNNGTLIKGDKAFLLFRTIESAYRAYEGGIKFPNLQVGNTYTGEGKVQVAPTLYLSQEQVDILKKCQEDGVDVYYRGTPNQDRFEIENLVKKAKGLSW